jgi:hypothetical protein
VTDKPRNDESRRAQDFAALRIDYQWWSFYWTQSGVLTAVYLGVGPQANVIGYTAEEVRTKIEQAERHRSDELIRLRQEFATLTIWSSESGRVYAIHGGPQSGPVLVPVLEANSPAELRRQVAGAAE